MYMPLGQNDYMGDRPGVIMPPATSIGDAVKIDKPLTDQFNQPLQPRQDVTLTPEVVAQQPKA